MMQTTTTAIARDSRMSLQKIASFDDLASMLDMSRVQLLQIMGGQTVEAISKWIDYRNAKKERELTAVIDASVVRVKGFMDYLRQRFRNVIVTNITMIELNRLKDSYETNWDAAQALLHDMVEDNRESFYIQDIEINRLRDESGEYDNDFSIIAFCKEAEEYGNNVVLVSADGGQVVRARNHGVKTIFLDRIMTENLITQDLSGFIPHTVLSPEDLRGQKYSIMIKNNDNQIVEEFPYKIELGDDIYLATKETCRGRRVIVFKHLRIVDLDPIIGGIVKKIIFKENDVIQLYNYGDFKEKLEFFLNDFRNRR